MQNLRVRAESDRNERSPAISSNLSDHKVLKSRDVSGLMNGQSGDHASLSGSLDGNGVLGSLSSKTKISRDICNLCKKGGKLINCESCPRAFHRECLRLKQDEMPEADWNCQACR